MHFIHARRQLNKGDVVELTCESTCNFMLTDEINFTAYKNGELFSFYGGHFESFPATITAPHAGEWNIIIDTPSGAPLNSWDIKIV